MLILLDGKKLQHTQSILGCTASKDPEEEGKNGKKNGFFTTVPSVEAGSSVLPIDSHVPQFYPFGEHGT